MSNIQRTLLNEGKAKIIYSGISPNTVIQYFKDDLTAFNNQKKKSITGKGELNCCISTKLFTLLQESGVNTHFIKSLNLREQLVNKLEIIPIEVIVRNYAAGSICKRLNLTSGKKLPRVIIEYCYKKDDLNDPMISTEHILAFNWANRKELEKIVKLSLQINTYLSGLFAGIDLILADFKLEFGRYRTTNSNKTEILLADEISPDTCRLWDRESGKSFDKDLFRHELGDIKVGYEDVARRLKTLVIPSKN